MWELFFLNYEVYYAGRSPDFAVLFLPKFFLKCWYRLIMGILTTRFIDIENINLLSREKYSSHKCSEYFVPLEQVDIFNINKPGG